jgi:hypothetical protein
LRLSASQCSFSCLLDGSIAACVYLPLLAHSSI